MYTFDKEKEICSPCLIFYTDLIEANILKMIEMAGTADKLWPHIKTHKCSDIVKLQIKNGISRFKTATIAEAKAVASVGALHVILAYPLVGPNIKAFKTLCDAYKNTKFYAVADNLEQVKLLAKYFTKEEPVNLLIDVNLGQERTGVNLENLEGFYRLCQNITNVNLMGLHCYDGHRHEKDFSQRIYEVEKTDNKLKDIIERLENCEIVVLGGTPSFPCHIKCMENAFYSPGTLVLHDYGYSKSYPDMNFDIAATVLTRVISRPTKNTFTIDLGTKAVSCDSKEVRAVIYGIEYAKTVMHSEEHMVLELDENDLHLMPSIGDELYALPWHICPTVALYNKAVEVQNGKFLRYLDIDARDRI